MREGVSADITVDPVNQPSAISEGCAVRDNEDTARQSVDSMTSYCLTKADVDTRRPMRAWR